MYCENCGAKLNDNEKFCKNCGAKTRNAQIAVCPVCGQKINPGTKFCKSCGASIGNGPVPQQPQNASREPRQQAVCRNCGQRINPGEKFCQNCGTPIQFCAPPAAKQAEQPEAPEQFYTPPAVKQAEQPEAPVCPVCGKPVTPGAKFCKACGTPTGNAAKPEAPVCPVCGKPVTPGAKFCKACGAPTRQQNARRTPYPYQPPYHDARKYRQPPVKAPKRQGKKRTVTAIAVTAAALALIIGAAFLIRSNIFAGLPIGKSVKGVLNNENKRVGTDTLALEMDYYDLEGETECTIKPVRAPELEGSEIHAYEFKLNNDSEELPVMELTMPYDEKALGGRDPSGNVGAGYFNKETNEWEPVLFNINDNGTVTVYTDHLSTFGCFVIKNENTRLARAALICESQVLQRLEAYARTGADTLLDEDDCNLIISEALESRGTPTKSALEMGKKLFRLSADYLLPSASAGTDTYTTLFIAADDPSFPMLNAYNKFLSIIGVCFSAAVVAKDFLKAYRNPDVRIPACKEAFSLSTGYIVGKVGGALGSLGFLGVAVIDYGINKIGEMAVTGKYNNWLKTLKAYEESLIIGNAKYYYYDIFYESFQKAASKIKDNYGSAEDFKNSVWALVKAHVDNDGFWKLPDTENKEWYKSVNHGTFISEFSEFPAQKKEQIQEQITNEYIKELLMSDGMQYVFGKLAEWEEENVKKALINALTELQKHLNTCCTLKIYDATLNAEKTKSDFAGAKVFVTVPEIIKDANRWSVRLDNRGEGEIKFTFFAYLMAGQPSELRVCANGDSADSKPTSIVKFSMKNNVERVNIGCGMQSMDVALVLDTSGSMEGAPIRETKSASINFIDTLINQNARIGIVTYSSSAGVASGFQTDKGALNGIISGLSTGGNTNTSAGLGAGYSMLQNSTAKKRIIMLMSDGQPNEGKLGAELAAYVEEIKSSGIIVYTMGFFGESGYSEEQKLMGEIASEGLHFEVSDAAEITASFNDVAEQLSGQKYMHIKMECPVDVSVTYQGETLNSAESALNKRTSFGTLSFEESTDYINSGGDRRAKVLRLKEGAAYDIQITGNGSGRMDYTIGFMDKNGDYTDFREFKNIRITEQTVIDTVAKKGGSTTLSVDENGDGRYDFKYKAKENGRGKPVNNLYILFIVIGVILLGAAAAAIILLKKRRARAPKAVFTPKFCERCGAPLTVGAAVCASCGTPVPTGNRAMKTKTRKLIIIVSIGLALFAVLVTLITVAASNSGSAGAVKKIMKAYKEYDIDTLTAMTSGVWFGSGGGEHAEYEAENKKEELEQMYKQTINAELERLEYDIGHYYKLNCQITDKHELNESEADALKYQLGWYLCDDFDLPEKIIAVEITVTGKSVGKTSSTVIRIYLSKENGAWKLLLLRPSD